jgi:predicted nucleotidyltransferase component of viral defense system
VAIRWHETDPTLLLEAIRFTSTVTGFLPRLVEKDYFCSVLLEHLSVHEGLVFKGGTCLAKVYLGHYRLSEDLDFSIATTAEARRTERRRTIAPVKKLVDEITVQLPAFRVLCPLTGANSSTQYTAVLQYDSLLGDLAETIKVEVGLREPLLTAPTLKPASTLLTNPLRQQPLVGLFDVSCLSRIEAMAEKLRAALSRRDVAIRDFFDVDYATHHDLLDPGDPLLLELVRQKCAVPGTGSVDVSSARLDALRRQLNAQLRPVLREQDLNQFDLDRAIAIVRAIATAMH